MIKDGDKRVGGGIYLRKNVNFITPYFHWTVLMKDKIFGVRIETYLINKFLKCVSLKIKGFEFLRDESS